MKHILTYLVFTLSMLIVVAMTAEAKPYCDVKVLIDNSAQMQKLDEKKLRLEIIDQLQNLLVDDCMLAIDTFSAKIHTIIAQSPLTKINKIDTDLIINHKESDQKSDLKEALLGTISNWQQAGAYKSRHLILLTADVDMLNGSYWQNEEQKADILQSLAGQFFRENIKIHTFSLKGNNDQEFLQKLAATTNGKFSQITDNEDTELALRETLKELIVKKQTATMLHSFNITEKNQEAILFFQTDVNKAEPILITPQKNKITMKSEVKNIDWQQQRGINIISIKETMPGQWGLVGSLPVDSPLQVYTNLELKLAADVKEIFSGETIYVGVDVVSQNQIITEKDFLNSLSLQAIYVDPITDQETLMPLSQTPNGSYGLTIGPFTVDRPDKIIIKIVEKNSFIKQTLEKSIIREQVPVNFKQSTSISKSGDKLLSLELTLNEKLINHSDAMINAQILDNNDSNFEYMVPKIATNKWQLELEPGSDVSKFFVTLSLTSTTKSGRKLNLKTAPLVVLVPEIAMPDPIVEKETKIITKKAKLSVSFGKIMTLFIILIIFNVVLVGVAFIGLKLYRQHKTRAIGKITAEMEA